MAAGKDEAIFTSLIQRTLTSSHEVVVRPCDGVATLMKKFPGYLEEFKYRGDVVKAVVVRDGDNKCTAELRQKMQKRLSGRHYPFGLCLLIIPQELEAWLLADTCALSQVTGQPQARIPNPETISDPKRRLQELLTSADIYYTAEQARKIAQALNLEILAQQCPSFARLRRFLTATA
ncbi:DUF4276 family protein [Nitrospira sp. Kam-Ns4a]